MNRYIDADALINKAETVLDEHKTIWFDAVSVNNIHSAPSIDIVRCKECKHGEYREDFDDYECHSSGCGLVYDANFYCADGERRESE